jgi:hypothetical protein
MSFVLHNEKAIVHQMKKLILDTAEDLQGQDQVLTKQEAADFLKISVHAIERLAFKRNLIAYSKPGKSAVFLKSDLLRFLSKRRIPSIYDEGV